MSVIIKQDCRIAPDGHTVKDFKKGDVVIGTDAEFALSRGLAEEVKAEEPKPKTTKPRQGPRTQKIKG